MPESLRAGLRVAALLGAALAVVYANVVFGGRSLVASENVNPMHSLRARQGSRERVLAFGSFCAVAVAEGVQSLSFPRQQRYGEWLDEAARRGYTLRHLDDFAAIYERASGARYLVTPSYVAPGWVPGLWLSGLSLAAVLGLALVRPRER